MLAAAKPELQINAQLLVHFGLSQTNYNACGLLQSSFIGNYM